MLLIPDANDGYIKAAIQPPESIDIVVDLQRWIKENFKEPASLTVVRRIGVLNVGVVSVPKVTVQVC
jgi:hypothetical protein